MKAVLDTSVLLLDAPETLDGELAISAASLAELHFGVLVASNAKVRGARLLRLSAIKGRFDPLPIDDDVAASYGLLAAAVVEAGRQPRARVFDLLIAATAHAHGASLYTANPEDVAGLEDLVPIIPVPTS